jgi:hypothetical protein
VDRPRRWETGFIGRFMVEFGLVSLLMHWFFRPDATVASRAGHAGVAPLGDAATLT